MTDTAHRIEQVEVSNPYSMVVLNDSDERVPELTAIWAEIRARLNDNGTYTVDDLVDATGAHRSIVRALLYYGRKHRKVRMVEIRRSVEVARDLFMSRPVRAFRTWASDR
ncbi:hypothetical protein [Microbacterium sp. K5D]|uniref:hypothetical protein n=1 Tax=Microbacterium sp. K5D TaxID=2305436 RepID=UPI00109C6EB8|nr:hypothetical protein [Microbacterium sp. K5D]